MSQSEPTLDDLQTGAVSMFQADLNLESAPNPRGFVVAVIKATAGLAKLCIKYSQGLLRNTFAHLADNESLLVIAKEYGIFLRQPQTARIQVKVIAENVNILPAGTILVHKTGNFTTHDVVNFVNNVASVTAIAQNPGRNQDIQAGDELNIQNLLSANQSASVISVDYAGQNQETYEELRQRLLAIIGNLGPAGSQPYYIRQALLQDGVREAYVYRGPDVAQVNIYPIMANRSLPDKTERARLLRALSDTSVAFVGDYIQIMNFKIVQVTVKVLNLSRASLPPSAQPRITAAIKEYIESRRPAQHTLEGQSIWYISSLDIYAIISNIGGISANVSLDIDGQAVDMYALKSPIDQNYNIQPELSTLKEVLYA